MHLGSYNSAKNHYDAFRDLTAEELNQHTAFTSSLAEARNRLSLFRMLARNYTEWRQYLNRLLSPDFHEDNNVSEELNRLLLNYLTFAYAIQEHFEVSLRQRFKKDPATLKAYSDFVDRLCKLCWPFAFFLDFRGYFQHVGLGISANSRKSDDTSVRISVKACPSLLLAGSRQWKRSGLTAEKRDLDLVALLKEFHIQMFQSYAKFVAKTFFPELQPADEFYGRLTKEVQERHPTARMIFFSKKPKFRTQPNAKSSIKFTAIAVPNNVYREIGIIVERA